MRILLPCNFSALCFLLHVSIEEISCLSMCWNIGIKKKDHSSDVEKQSFLSWFQDQLEALFRYLISYGYLQEQHSCSP